MHRHCGTNNRAPRWTFTDPCKPEVRPGAREESASPAWLAAPAMNAYHKKKEKVKKKIIFLFKQIFIQKLNIKFEFKKLKTNNIFQEKKT